MVYYFVFAVADPQCNVTNKGVAALFKLSPRILHKLVSGKKYHGGSHREARKIKSIEELEEHGEKMVMVIKKKPPKVRTSGAFAVAGSAKGGTKGGKSKVTVTKMGITPRIIPLLFLDETPALGTRGACKKKKEEEDPKKQ